MQGLVLQGGGTRGAYQAGAYFAFKKCHIKFNAVCGTSIGAINGLFIACGKDKELLNLWQTIDVGKIFNFDANYLDDLKHNRFNIKNSFKNYWAILKSGGLESKGLIELVKNSISPEMVQKSKIDYGLCTVRLDRFLPKPLYIFKEDIPNDKLFDYVMASCRLPIFKWEKSIDNHYYLDGGFYDNTPINMLIKKGYQKIYVVELNPFLNVKRKIKGQAEIIRITPRRSLGGVLTLNNANLNEYIKMGYYDTLRVLKKLDGFNYCFRRRSNLYYNWLARKILPQDIHHLQGFFNAQTKKIAIIKAIEYLMQREEIDYYQIYSVRKALNLIKKKGLKNHFVDEIIRQLRFL